MANITVGGMPTATSITDSDLMHVIQSGVDKNATIALLIANILPHDLVEQGAGTPTLTNKHMNLEVDTGLGDIAITLPDGTFEGQQIRVTVDGTGLAKITATGIDYIVYVSLVLNSIASYEVLFTWSNGRYTVSGGVTAEYAQSSQYITKRSDRTIENTVDYAIANDSDVQFTLSETIDFGSQFTPDYAISNCLMSTTAGLGAVFGRPIYTLPSVISNTIKMYLASPIGGVTFQGSFTVKGKYA